MQLQLSINDLKASIFLELFKKDKLVDNYRVIDRYNDYEKEILSDMETLNLSVQNDGYKTGKTINIDDIK